MQTEACLSASQHSAWQPCDPDLHAQTNTGQHTCGWSHHHAGGQRPAWASRITLILIYLSNPSSQWVGRHKSWPTGQVYKQQKPHCLNVCTVQRDSSYAVAASKNVLPFKREHVRLVTST